VDLGGARLLPGFVDAHAHGAGGAAFYAGEADQVAMAARLHAGQGTTAMLASLPSLRLPAMVSAARTIARVVREGHAPNVVGIHFEGPFISPLRRGAHDSTAIVPPSARALETLIEAADGLACTVTIAPELPDAIGLIERYSADAMFALGHSAGDAEDFRAGVDAGARCVTHLFNAMDRPLPRAPGPAPGAILDQRVCLEIIADGVHVDPLMIGWAVAAAGVGRVLFVSDASAAAGLGNGSYELPDREIDVVDGRAYVRGTRTLGGSIAFLSRAVRTVSDYPQAAQVALTSGTAARLLGLEDRGHLLPGARADMVSLSATGEVDRVWMEGRPLDTDSTGRQPNSD
jgi:N-acetylglucosamine-6-phosphate deacetylase